MIALLLLSAGVNADAKGGRASYKSSGSKSSYKSSSPRPKTVSVRGYTKKDGTVVGAYKRAAPKKK